MLPSRAIIAVMLVPAMLMLSACGMMRGAPKDAAVPVENTYQKQVSEDAQTACAAANRALLGDGYLTEPTGGDKVKGRKAYRTEGDRNTIVEVTVICLPDPTGGSTLYANGLRSTYELKKSATPASIGVSVIGSVSLPIGQNVDSMVKTSDETITDRGFYQKLFNAVEGVLNSMRQEPSESKAKKEAAPADKQP